MPQHQTDTDHTRLITETDLRHLLAGASRSTIHRWRRQDDTFPRAVKIGPHRIGFRLAEVRSWLASRQTA